jgi:hypothetical protein
MRSESEVTARRQVLVRDRWLSFDDTAGRMTLNIVVRIQYWIVTVSYLKFYRVKMNFTSY